MDEIQPESTATRRDRDRKPVNALADRRGSPSRPDRPLVVFFHHHAAHACKTRPQPFGLQWVIHVFGQSSFLGGSLSCHEAGAKVQRRIRATGDGAVPTTSGPRTSGRFFLWAKEKKNVQASPGGDAIPRGTICGRPPLLLPDSPLAELPLITEAHRHRYQRLRWVGRGPAEQPRIKIRTRTTSLAEKRSR